MRRPRSSQALAFALAALSAGCATTAPAPREVVWPQPPDTPRIRFVRALRDDRDFDRPAVDRLVRLLLGVDARSAFRRPMGLALSPGGERLYVADPGAGAVFVADFAQGSLDRFAPAERLGRPFGVAVDSAENVYVTDPVGKQVVVLDRNGRRLRSLGAGARLERPTGIALDRSRGVLYVADSSSLASDAHRIVAFALDGHVLREVGARGGGDGEFYFPVYLAVDARGDLYVGDTLNFRIQVLDPDGRFVRKYGEQGDGPGAFDRIKGLAFDGFGNLYVVDGEHAVVQLFNREFDGLMYFAGCAPALEYLELPSAIAIDPRTNTIYVADQINPRVNVYQLINTRAADSGVAALAAAGARP